MYRNEELTMDSLDKVRARQKAQSEKKNSTHTKKSDSAERKPSGTKSGGNSASRTRRSPGQSTGAVSPRRTAPTGERPVSSSAPSQSKPRSAHQSAATGKARKRRRRRSHKHPALRWVSLALKILLLLLIAGVIGFAVWVASIMDFSFGDDLSSMNLNISSTVYYTDESGKAVEYAQFDASENRVWVSIDTMPNNLVNAFVAIEDQRFFKHMGVDIKRTGGAVLNYVMKGDSSYGGSTITQQLVKNITNDKEHAASRKVREMLRAIVLETKLSKEQILEMYMNTIYLSQGANGVEAASNIYFSKEVSELTLAECACIAGITQYPARYDPITQPEANEKKRILVLDKMLELGYINKQEYKEAKDTKIEIHEGKVKNTKIQSYFLDNLFEEIQDDLVDKGYTETFAANMIYNGGLKIYATVDPAVQETMEEYFEDSSNFPKFSGETQPQAAMIVSDPHTGEIKGVVGGRGTKDRARGLNRASQSKRQPGSSIKPIAVYAPALDLGLITASTRVDDSPLDIDGWRPKNSGGKFRGYVSVSTAVHWSYNIPAIRVLEEVTVDKSFDYLKNKLHMDSLVTSKTANGKTFSDKNLSALALGGLTDGVTVMEMNGAYSALANGGKYIEPHSYNKVYDVEGKILLKKEPVKNQAFAKETAYLMSDLLKGVVKSGTGTGAQISGMDTCGKTGTTDDNKDRWFIGYTPYYVASVWFGYDIPKVISASGNPAMNIWEDIMSDIHEELPEKHFDCPKTIEERTVCSRTGHSPTSECTRVTQYANVNFADIKCTSDHSYIGTKPYKSISAETPDKKDDTSSDNDGDEPASSGDSGTDTGSAPATHTPPPTASGSDSGSSNQ